MTSATPSSSPQFSAVQQFYEAVTHWDFEALEKLFAENYVHKTLPASANDPPKNKAEGIAHARAIGAMLGHAPLKHEILQSNESAGSVWVHSRTCGEIAGGVQFSSESIYIFTLSSGDDVKITAIQEFIDTKLTAEFAAAAAGASPSSASAQQ